MADAGVIQEFFVALGYKIDEGAQQRFQKGTSAAAATVGQLNQQVVQLGKTLAQLGNTLAGQAGEPARKFDEAGRKLIGTVDRVRKETVDLGLKAAAVATTFAAGVLQISKNFEQLYYTAQLTRTSVADLEALQAGFKQIGIASDQATAAFVEFQRTLREHPEVQPLVAYLAPPAEVAKLQERMHGMVDYARAQYEETLLTIGRMASSGNAGLVLQAKTWADMLHISTDEAILAYKNQDALIQGQIDAGERLKRVYGGITLSLQEQADAEAKARREGTDPAWEIAKAKQAKVAQQAVDLQRRWNNLLADFSGIWNQVFTQAAALLGPVIDGLDKILGLVQVINNLVPGAALIEGWVAVAAGITAADAALALLLGRAPMLVRMIGLAARFATPWGLIATLIAEAAEHWRDFVTIFTDLSKQMGGAIDRLGENLKPFVDVLKTALGWVKETYEWTRALLGLPKPGQEQPPLPPGPPGPPRPTGEATPFGGPATPGEQVFHYTHGGIVPGFQAGGIVPINAHAGEMVLPAEISHGLQRLFMQPATARFAGADEALGEQRRSQGLLGDWLSGQGFVPKVEIAKFDEEQAGFGELAGRVIGGVVGGIGGAISGEGTAAGAERGARAGARAGAALDRVLSGGEGTGASVGPITDPRYGPGGSRAFNYGNIGITGGHERAFASAQEGLLALQQNLMSYQEQHGINTLAGIINRWSPPNENPTAELIGNAAKRTGLDPNARLDLHDPSIMRKLTEAIIVQEHSRIPREAAQTLAGNALQPGELGRGGLTQDELKANWAARTGVLGTPGEAGHNLVTITAPNGARFQVNRMVAPQFQGFLNDLSKSFPNIVSGGGYANRPIRGGTTPSEHAFGAAIDINPEENPMLLNKLVTNLPANIGEIAAKWGLKWGGTFAGRKDPMHFEAAQQQLPWEQISKASAQLDRISATQLGGDTTNTTNQGDKNLTMNVQHTVNISGNDGGDTVGRYAGAARRLYGDMRRDLATNFS